MDAAMNASLKETRFVRLRAEIGTGAVLSGTGQIKAEISAGMQETGNENQSVAQVTIKVTAIPQGTDDASQFAFQIEVVGNGLYEWPSGKIPNNLKDLGLNRLLCQPIYTLAVSEAVQLAQRMGFNNVRLPWDIPTESTDASPAKKARAPRKATKPVSGRRAKAA